MQLSILWGEMIIKNVMLFYHLSPTDRFIPNLAHLNYIYILAVIDDTGMNILTDKSFPTSLIMSQKIPKRGIIPLSSWHKVCAKYKAREAFARTEGRPFVQTPNLSTCAHYLE